jgi:OOP family OmpA-OmpF porin
MRTPTLRTRILFGAMCLAFAATAARADADDVGKHYVTSMVQGVWLDNDRNADDHYGFQVGFGKALNTDWNLELNYAHSLYAGALGNDLKLDNIEIDALRVFYRDTARVNPYLLGGIGWLGKNFRFTDDTSELAASLGGGLLMHLHSSADGSQSVSLRAEFRERYELNSGGNKALDSLASLGLQIAWGAPRPAVPAAPIAQPPADSDGDGVLDTQDRCPGTPAGAKVDAFGCELDSDGDGVVDSKDQCPGTPAGRKVNAVGCEVDSDGDDVLDNDDQCPNTVAGARVDVKGCEIKDEIKLPGVIFATDKATLLPESYPVLNDAVATLRKYPDLKIEVAGHTDSRGSDAYNKKLSQRRAETVEKYLKDGGATNEMKAMGYGESDPVADNSTEDGRRQNRRVALKIL